MSHNRFNNGAASVGGIIPQLTGTSEKLDQPPEYQLCARVYAAANQ